MIAGAHDEAPQMLRKALQPAARRRRPVFHRRDRAAPEAAWINGTAGHALDYDDVAVRGHASTVLVPAILAEAETLGARRPRDDRRLCRRLREPGPSCRAATPAITTARAGTRPASSARSAPARPAPICAGSTRSARRWRSRSPASQAGGIMANFGTMTKPFHAGRAAHAGVVSARLAELGFTAAADALEHPQGFLSAVSPEGKADRDGPSPGSRRGMAHREAAAQHQEIPGLLLHPPLARRDARSAGAAAVEAGRDRPDHRLDQRDACADPAQPPAADRARRQVQHGIRDGGGGDRPPRQPRRVHRRIRPPPRGAGADAPGRRSRRTRITTPCRSGASVYRPGHGSN